MCLQVSYKKKMQQKYFFASLKSLKKESDPELDPDPLVNTGLRGVAHPLSFFHEGRSLLL
jgi:hypothetical protein